MNLIRIITEGFSNPNTLKPAGETNGIFENLIDVKNEAKANQTEKVMCNYRW